MRAGDPAQNGPSHSPTGVGNPVDDGGTEVEYAYTTVTPDPILRYCPNLNSKKNDTGKMIQGVDQNLPTGEAGEISTGENIAYTVSSNSADWKHELAAPPSSVVPRHTNMQKSSQPATPGGTNAEVDSLAVTNKIPAKTRVSILAEGFEKQFQPNPSKSKKSQLVDGTT